MFHSRKYITQTYLEYQHRHISSDHIASQTFAHRSQPTQLEPIRTRPGVMAFSLPITSRMDFLMCLQSWRVSSDELAEDKENDQCTICCEGYCPELHTAIEWPCGHLFGEDCIIGWFDDHDTRPACRQIIVHFEPVITAPPTLQRPQPAQNLHSERPDCPVCAQAFNYAYHFAVELPCGHCIGADCLSESHQRVDSVEVAIFGCSICEMTSLFSS